ncbi:hypothetical protein LM599_02935 [Candidatus Acetothermia bacterium]|jgi:hypothetical protein|nr:hypothetical protein [Candidatus Acetothermia bacterium]MCI2427164.1 hypothetical protein [Candidatus Acetothermia bacterium]MCI2428723.1 hypothetical protein [Candidatus Acetothermia bacterium]
MNRRVITGLVVVSLISLVALSAIGTSVAELERLATRELVPEIQLAAGIALGRHYAEVKTLAEMKSLAVEGATPGMRMAAQIALEHLFVAAGTTRDELLVIAETGATMELRRAVLPALNRFLPVIAPTVDETAKVTGRPAEELAGKAVAVLRVEYLRGLVERGVTAEVRLAGARGLLFLHRIHALRLEKIAREAIAELEPAHITAMRLKELEGIALAAIAIAAGEYLGGWLLFHPDVVKTQEEMVELTRTGETEGLRVAGSTALIVRLIAGEMTARDLKARLLSIMGIFSVEYRAAYMWALADRLAVP